jgi:hypothetical protein
MIDHLIFNHAKANMLYLKHGPMINAAKNAAGRDSEFGFKNGCLPRNINKLELHIESSMIKDLSDLNSASSSRVPMPELAKFAAVVSRSLVLLKPNSLWDLSQRGILSPECAVALSNFEMIPTSDIAKAAFDMILEYKDSGLTEKHKALLMRRLLPYSYYTYMKNKFKVSPSDMFFFIHTKTFPHVSLDIAVKFVKRFKKEYNVSNSFAMFFAKEYVEFESHLKDAVDAVPTLMKDNNVRKYIAEYYQKSYKNPGTALKKADTEASIYSERFGISLSDARYFKKEYKNTEAVIKNAKTLINTIENDHKNDKGSKITPSDIMFHVKKNPRNTEAALKNTVDNALTYSEKHDIHYYKAKYYEKERRNPEKSLIKAIENGEIKKKKHT